ncbi:MAG: 2-aminoethylphosphonate--pyruvate transaminase [Roseomonas sp.]|jgi:2-aminoethylphosphonate-pyruvate transaminase|nr:2-aminoethylphosphonate--pyruvate transaminase [Roseomonas sp.]
MLFTPGPLALPAEVREQMLVDLGSRSATIRGITLAVRDSLVRLIGAQVSHSAILIQGSGTFAVEGALATFVSPSDKVLVIVNGVYGERIRDILSRRRLQHRTLTCPPTESPDVHKVSEILADDPAITHLCFVHCETTTGILNPISELAAVARMHGVLSIVDAMSAYGGVPIDAGSMGFDILVASGNKCVEAPPGIAFAVVRRTLLQRKATHAESFCLDLYDQWRSFEADGEWRSTPPTHVLQALHAALRRLEVETVDRRAARYSAIQMAIVAGMEALGFTTLIPASLRSPVCAVFTCPEWAGQEAERFTAFHRHLDEAGLHIYAKLHTPTRSFRIGCIGHIESHWVDLLLDRVASFQAAPALVAGVGKGGPMS